MKKKIGWCLAVIVIIAMAYGYAYIDQAVSIYDKAEAVENYVAGKEINKDFEVNQVFISKQKTIKGIRIKCKTFVENPTAEIQYELREVETGNIVAEGTTESKDIKNSKFHEFGFPEIKNCEGKEFSFRLSANKSEEGNSIGIYKTVKSEKGTLLSENGSEVEGTIVMRTVSHLFSLETFIIVLFFITYILVFVKILYKFFR